MIRGAEDLRRLGVDTQRAAFFVALVGRRLARGLPAQQLRLFAPGEPVTSGPSKTTMPPSPRTAERGSVRLNVRVRLK